MGLFMSLKEKDCKKLNANWFRKGGMALTALAVVTICLFFVYLIVDSGKSNYIDGIPDIVIHIFISVAALCGVLVFLYQLISIFTNKMILSQNGIEIKRLFSRVNVLKDDVIRIDGIYERVIGAPTKNRSIFKIITNKKTYEVNSHEFFGLKQAVSQWVQKNMAAEKGAQNDEA